MKIIELEEVNSTNEYCKGLDCDAIVIAGCQTAGKGTKGRSFCSDEGGLYLSVRRTYSGFDFSDTFKIMINACTAVCRTLGKFGFKPVVRWANDVLLSGRKISGTLIENTLLSGNMCRSIVGIGINVNNALPEELKGIATSLAEQAGAPADIKAVRSALIENLGKEYTVDDYKSYINWFGSEVTVTAEDGEYTAVALDVCGDGRLVIDRKGDIVKLSCGEVGIRLK